MSAPAEGIRRLKAIMFTDIKGYSAMMGVDEARTVQLVLEHRDIVREVIARHDGQEHETIGDAFVVLFDSVVNAVRCGAEIQGRMRQRNEGLAAPDQLWLRIGIHLGDILVQGDGIYGDGVNLAARVESQAEPGGICITEQVWLQVDGRVDMDVEPLGRVDLKNIRNPPQLYRVHPKGAGPVRGRRKRRGVVVAAALAVVAVAGGGLWLATRPGAPVVVRADGTAQAAVAAPVQPGAGAASTPGAGAQAGSAAAEAGAGNAAGAEAGAKAGAGAGATDTAALAPPASGQDGDARRKALVQRKIEEALAADGPAKLTLLREALALEPDNAALQGLVRNLEAEAQAAARAPTPAARPARQARDDRHAAPPAAGNPASAKERHDPANPAPTRRIQPTLVID